MASRVEEMMEAMGQWILVESVTTASSFSSACCLSQPASLSVSCPMDRNEALMMGSRLVCCLDAHVSGASAFWAEKSHLTGWLVQLPERPLLPGPTGAALDATHPVYPTGLANTLKGS